MTNLEIAARFAAIADMLEILGEGGFRAVSYQRAARILEDLPQDAADLVGQGRLGEIPGIGEALAEKISEYVRTGRIAYHDELRASLPPGLLQLLDVPGLGPKKVRVLWQEVGVTDLDTLQKAAETHRLRRVKGFGEKTEENVLRGIRLVREGQSRILLSVAASVADRVLEHLRANAPVERASVAGSLRRMRETVGDIDLLVAAEDRESVVRAFTSMPGVREVVAAGDTKATVRYEAGERLVQLDLRILDPDSWGAGLLYFTGSKDHNIRLRGMAVDRELKLNEYGLFRKDEKVASLSEDDVYAALDLPWIPPEMREDRGEIALALEGRLPRIVDLPDVRGDFHVHTDATDGTEPLERMVVSAEVRGYAYVGISDHSVSLQVARGLSADRVLAHRDSIRALNAGGRGITVLAGTECDILDGGAMDYPDEVLRELDFAIASVHSKFHLPRREMTDRVVAAVRNPYVSILAHPTTRKIGARGPIDADFDEVYAACASSGTAIEVNADPYRMDLDDAHARAAKEAGCVFALDTDAHASADLAWMRFAVGLARRAWLAPDDVVNTWPLERVRAFLR
ncbi:MAG: DNA polymerase/3'-5' exonuclease PolX [Methanobacteriota archaeon]